MTKRKSTAATPAPSDPVEQTSTAEQASAQSPAEAAKRPLPDPFLIARDAVAGVRLLESRRYRQMQLSFEDKPAPAVLETVRAEQFRWNSIDKVWTKQLDQDTALRTRIDAERLFKQVADMIRQEKGIADRPR